jgi:hypothetical protein
MMNSNVKAHDRRFGLLAADLVGVRFKADVTHVLTHVRDELDSLLKSSPFFNGAPFEWITLSIQFGLQNGTLPRYHKINAKYRDLPMSIEVDSNELRSADHTTFAHAIRNACLVALLDAGKRYGLNIEHLQYYVKHKRPM